MGIGRDLSDAAPSDWRRSRRTSPATFPIQSGIEPTPVNLFARWCELIALFVIAPLATATLFWFKILSPNGLLFPIIWGLGLLAVVLLVRDRSFDRHNLWNWAGLREQWGAIVLRWVVLGAGALLLLYFYEPARLFILPRTDPGLWGAIMVGYPIASVFAQEVAFRAMFCHRYAPLLGDGRAMVLVNAAAFGLGHVVLLNWWAVGFCAIGGVLFAATYVRTKSLAAACFEHTLYGSWLFTAGWGWYFYSGGAATHTGVVAQ